MATAGYLAAVYLTDDAGTAMTGEGMSVSSGKTYYTTDAAKNLWDPTATFVVLDNGVTVDTDEYTLDYLMGKVTFDAGYSVTGPVTVTGKYLEPFKITTARGVQATFSRNLVESTVLGDTAVDRISGLADCAVTVDRLDAGQTDYDTGGSSGQTIYSKFSGGEWTLVEIYPDDGADEVWRCAVRFESDDLQSAPSDVQTASLSALGVLPGNLLQSFAYGDPTA